jgi:hypothetical protein
MNAGPLYAALLKERFSSTWWVTTRPEDLDSTFMQGVRRRALSEALEDAPETEEVA